MNKVLQTISIIVLAFLISSCSGEKAKQKIILGNEEWATNKSLSGVAHVLLEEMGYEVEIRKESVENIFSLVNSGEIDVFMDAWLPFTHDVYMFDNKSVVDLGRIYTGCKLGMAVPSYFDVDTIPELKRVSDQFDGKVYGINKDAGVMLATVSALRDNELELDIENSSEAELIEKIEVMIKDSTNFVVAAWVPHWKTSYFNLKFLVDTTNSYGEIDEIHVVTKEGLGSDAPEVVSFLKRIEFSDEAITDLLLTTKGSSTQGDYYQNAKKWVANNRELVATWIGKEE